MEDPEAPEVTAYDTLVKEFSKAVHALQVPVVIIARPGIGHTLIDTNLPDSVAVMLTISALANMTQSPSIPMAKVPVEQTKPIVIN